MGYIDKLKDVPDDIKFDSTDIQLSLKILDFICEERKDITTKAVLMILDATKDLALRHKLPSYQTIQN